MPLKGSPLSTILLVLLYALMGSLVGMAPVAVLAQQSATNSISLAITKVGKDGKAENTRKEANNSHIYDNELNLDDDIRYSWSGTDLNLKYKDTAAKGGGYLKVYLNDDTKEENLILDYGSSPLRVSSLKSKLVEGPNKILLVYIDSTNRFPTTPTKVAFSFKYKNFSSQPQIQVLEPASNVVIGRGADKDISLQLSNFELESTDSRLPNRGKLNVYANSILDQNRLGIFSLSQKVDGKVYVKFNTRDLEVSRIPDNLSTQLIFVLTSTSGTVSNFQTSLPVRSNYNGSLDVGLPKVTIIEPRKDRTNLTVDGNQKFIVQVDNFTILKETSKDNNEDTKGYLQIYVDNKPLKTLWPKIDFTLNEIGLGDTTEGRKTIKVQLVNKNFTKLSPEAVDSIDVIFAPKFNESNTEIPQIENQSWRIVLVIITVVLVVGGISILITRG